MHDADGSVIQSLSLNILGENKSAISSIDETITALVSLQATAVRMRDGVKVIKDLADSLQKLSKVKIPNSVPEQLQKIDAALKGTYGKGASGMKNVADAMQDIADNANKLPIAEQFDKGANDVGAFNSELEFVKENLEVIRGLLPDITSASAIRLPANTFNASAIGLPAYSSASLPEEIAEATQELPTLAQYLGLSERGMDKIVAGTIEARKQFDLFNAVVKDSPLPSIQMSNFWGSANDGFRQARPEVLDNAQMPVLASTMVSLKPAIVDTEKLSGEVESLASNLDKTSVSAKKTSEIFTQITKADVKKTFKDIGKSLKELGKETTQGTSKLGRLLSSIKRIALYRAIRAALKAITNGFKEGTTNLYMWSNAFDSTREFANSMDKIATSILYLKNSLGALVAPIINAVAPAFDFFIDKLVGVINVLNEFIAAMTGAATYTVAKKVATQYQDIADGAGKAAKAMKSFTIGIDELNIIEDNAGSGSGVGGAADVAADWFEKQNVSSWMKDFADAVKQTASDIYDVFEAVGNWGADRIEEIVEASHFIGNWGADRIEEIVAFATGVGNWGADRIEEAVTAWNAIKESDLGQAIGNWGADQIEAIVTAFTALGDEIKRVWGMLQENPWQTILKGLNPIAQKGFEIANEIKKFFSNVWDGLSTIVQGVLKQFKKIDPYLKLASGLAGGILGLNNSSKGAEEQGENDAKSYTSGFESTLKSWLVAFATPYGALLGNTTSKSAETAKSYVRPAAMSLGTSIINGAKDGVSANANSLYSKIGSIGQTTVSTFKNNASYSSFKSAGENIVNGIIAGLDAKKGQVYNSISVLASKTGSKFNYTLKIQSPSRFFMDSGKYIDEGLALGIDRNAYKVEDSVAKLSNTFTNFAPAIDTSKLSIPDAQALYGDVQGAITADSKVSVQRADESLQNFIMETLMPVVTRIADDTKRQADKSEVIEIDGRKLNGSLNRQSRNNGYSFT